MENLPPLSQHEQQFEDMRYSPDDFDPAIELPVEEFFRFFRQNTEKLIEDYQKRGLKVSPYLVGESRYTDEELSDIYTMLKRHNNGNVMTWGDFRTFLAIWEASWDG
ncbi:MAG: hypothetical protein JWO07_219, partial [Candidatus Saccharibacteria bacterium]|nr:hypothetical protein [Candidatus Saccharibacteria bacterium]